MTDEINFFGVPLEDLEDQPEPVQTSELNWSPGDTAPKDGWPILGCWATHPEPRIIRFSRGRWIDGYTHHFDPPDFWMPMPESPFK